MKQYNARINKAVRKSEKAIDKFMTTESQLQQQVEEIDATVKEIDSEIESLRSIKNSAIQRRKENIGIIGRIREFISGGE